MPYIESNTIYNLLISCPSDVKEEIDIIEEVVKNFNDSIGKINSIRIDTKHWSKSSYPQSGGKPQELLNKQFVLDCDLAVAVFWTRFGTPTDDYQSGSEEEIEKLIETDKQIFLYFSDCAIHPSSINDEQYNKVKSFRERYKNKGLYSTYESKEQFRKDFTNHLTLYFLNINNSSLAEFVPKSSQLKVIGVKNGEVLEDSFLLISSNLLKTNFIRNRRQEIIDLIDSIKSFMLPKSEPLEKIKEDDEDSLILPNELNPLRNINIKSLMNIGLSTPTPIEFSEIERQGISDFSRNNGISYNEEELFYVGNLKKTQNLLLTQWGGQHWNLEGTDEEKQKYELICDLNYKIIVYNQFIEYFRALDEKEYVVLAIANTGTHFDEDIDIEININKGVVCNHKDLPYPQNEILKDATKIVSDIFKFKKTLNLDEYSGYIVTPRMPTHFNGPLIKRSYQEEIEEAKNRYDSKLDNIFNYEYYQGHGSDILKFKVGYLKQHANMFFPSVLVLNKPVEIIQYKITSKHNGKIIRGEIKRLENEH